MQPPQVDAGLRVFESFSHKEFPRKRTAIIKKRHTGAVGEAAVTRLGLIWFSGAEPFGPC